VVGFDGVDTSYFYPKITTARQDIKKIAQTLFEAVTRTEGKPVHEIVDVSVIIGESCKKIVLG
jgi:DNA-binding LacI/PurR family transcriptional regulator